jgi:hypothetical protein
LILLQDGEHIVGVLDHGADDGTLDFAVVQVHADLVTERERICSISSASQALSICRDARRAAPSRLR